VLLIGPVVSVLAVLFCWGFFHLVERHFLNPPTVGVPAPHQAPLAGEVQVDGE
jgi:hypothetical protein